jgi:hypothetical protein
MCTQPKAAAARRYSGRIRCHVSRLMHRDCVTRTVLTVLELAERRYLDMSESTVASTDTPSPTYLIEAYEAMSRSIEQFDETGDGRQLARALGVGCESLSRLGEDSGLWAAVQDMQRVEAGRLYGDSEVDEIFGRILEAERHILTQAGMSPRYVAQLLDQIEVAERAWMAGRGGSSSDRPSLIDSAPNIREGIRELASETCRESDAHRQFLIPDQPVSPDPPAPIKVGGASRIRAIVKAPLLVVGGAIAISGDIIAALHQALDHGSAETSAEMGFSTIMSGLFRKSR